MKRDDESDWNLLWLAILVFLALMLMILSRSAR